LLIAKRAHALALTEPRPGRGLDRAVDHAVGEAIRQDARRVLVLPSDLPTLSVAALDALAARAVAGNHCVIAPDSARTGTNALLLNARGRFAFSYGPGSCARHVEASRSRGWGVSVCVHPALALDIDTPHDLAVWIGSGSTLPRLQPMTLARISHVERRSSRSPVSIATDRAST
jgi:2-phospho-L-lactate guanylyltransferase